MGADLDSTELHVSIRSYLSRLPYVDASGLTTLDLPYESIDVKDVCYEPKVTEVSTAKIVLPSLLAFPELRSLLQNIKEGDRVEIYWFQPDCGDPVFAGFLPSGGIEEQDGKTILNIEDTLGQLRWQHIRRFEYYNTNADGFYRRAMSIWQDLVNEDFLGTNPAGDYGTYTVAPAPTLTWGQGFVEAAGNGNVGQVNIYPTTGPAASFPINPGDTFIVECDCSLNNLFVFGLLSHYTEIALQLSKIGAPSGTWPQVDAILIFQNSTVAATPYEQWAYPLVINTAGGVFGATSPSGGTNLATPISMPSNHHLAMYCRFDAAGTVSVYVYLDNINVAFFTQPWVFDSTLYQPQIFATAPTASEYVQVTSWRVRRLSPVLLRAARFNPQTADAVAYQPNNEDNLQLLQLFAQKDNAEYRPLYHAWPQGTDELELDQVSTLGKHASAVLGYEQPPALPTEGSPQASPLPVITDVASFLIAPPFRFEEGFNLEAAPRIQPKANAHSNDIIRVGASTQDAQVFAEKWAPSETGRPQHSPSGAQYPYFEVITNDDRVGIQSLNASLAGLDLARGIDATQSLELLVVDELPWAFRWRVGDFVWVKTLSLRNNVEQEMRVVKNAYKAGSPLRTVTLGKTDLDPSMMRMFAEDMKISWLYEQSGTSPTIYVYPSVGNINAGATSPIFSIPLDQFTTGSALVYAAVHWFADANVMKIQPMINGTLLDLTGVVSASTTDSGLQIVTNAFQGPGTYTLAFKNIDVGARNLTGAFLVLRVKG